MKVIKHKKEKLILGTTTSVLLDMREADATFRRYGANGYRSYMRERIDEPLPVNDAFAHALRFSKRPNHEVILLSRNSPITAVRAIRTMIFHGIVPTAFAFTNGQDPTRYLKAYGVDNFQSANPADVERAIALGFAASHIDNGKRPLFDAVAPNNATVTRLHPDSSNNLVVLTNRPPSPSPEEHHVFDFDGVTAGLSSEHFYQENGLELYREFERANLARPLEKGPLHNWLVKLTNQKEHYMTSICTVRGGWAAFRCLYDLVQKDIDLNGEFHATAGEDKGPVLEILRNTHGLPAIFYDDRKEYVEQALRAGYTAGQVLHPVAPMPAA